MLSALFARLKSEPAVVIGILAAAALAAVKSLAGDGVLTGDFANWIERALNPTDGWAIPIILGFITRQFVFSPPSVQKIADAATFEDPGTKVDIGNPPEGNPEG